MADATLIARSAAVLTPGTQVTAAFPVYQGPAMGLEALAAAPASLVAIVLFPNGQLGGRLIFGCVLASAAMIAVMLSRSWCTIAMTSAGAHLLENTRGNPRRPKLVVHLGSDPEHSRIALEPGGEAVRVGAGVHRIPARYMADARLALTSSR